MNAEMISVIKARIAQLEPRDEPLYAAMRAAEKVHKESETAKAASEASNAWVANTTELSTLKSMLKTYEAPTPVTEAKCQN